MRAKLLLAGLALAAAAAPAAARPVVAVAAPVPASDLDRLVALLVPDVAMVDLTARTFNHGIDNGTIGDAGTRALYARHPGMRAHVEQALRPDFAKLMKRALPELRSAIAAILSAELNAREIGEAATFFASPTGRKVHATAMRTMGEKPGRGTAATRDAAMKAVMASLAPEDFPAMMAFAAGSAARKMERVNPQVGTASRAWADRLVAEHGKRINKRAKRLAERYARDAGRKAE